MVSVQGRTSWLLKQRIQNKESAASGCTSAAAQWVCASIYLLAVVMFHIADWLCVCLLSQQEQAQSICKVLSASFDCALTSDKSWDPTQGVVQLQNPYSNHHRSTVIAKNRTTVLLFYQPFLNRGHSQDTPLCWTHILLKCVRYCHCSLILWDQITVNVSY